MSSNTNNAKRLAALEKAQMLSRLLDTKYFIDARDAVDKGKATKGKQGETEFKKICAKAEVPDKMAKWIWSGLIAAEEPLGPTTPGW